MSAQLRRRVELDAIPLAKPAARLPKGTLATVRRQARDCTDCPLWRDATQTVFGAGNPHAPAMLIGEQPGAQEDLAGLPFVGPAGRLLDEGLSAAGITREALYLTNAVKHFKFEPRGKLRLHKRATAAEQAACRQWLAAELLRVRPRLIVALGAMAAQTVFGNTFRLTRERGHWHALPSGQHAMATWHPSALLRMREPQRTQARAEFMDDLRALHEALETPPE